jgi:hypothetical protein
VKDVPAREPDKIIHVLIVGVITRGGIQPIQLDSDNGIIRIGRWLATFSSGRRWVDFKEDTKCERHHSLSSPVLQFSPPRRRMDNR